LGVIGNQSYCRLFKKQIEMKWNFSIKIKECLRNAFPRKIIFLAVKNKISTLARHRILLFYRERNHKVSFKPQFFRRSPALPPRDPSTPQSKRMIQWWSWGNTSWMNVPASSTLVTVAYQRIRWFISLRKLRSYVLRRK